MNEEGGPLSEGPKATLEGQAIDNDVINQFMEGQSDKYACPICSNPDWFVMMNEVGHVSSIPWSRQGGEIFPIGMPMLTLTCTRCGFARQHQLDIFKTYLESLKHGS